MLQVTQGNLFDVLKERRRKTDKARGFGDCGTEIVSNQEAF